MFYIEFKRLIMEKKALRELVNGKTNLFLVRHNSDDFKERKYFQEFHTWLLTLYRGHGGSQGFWVLY